MNQKKQEQIAKLKQSFSEAKSVVFADYHGLTAAKITELRNALKEEGADASVAKNTLVKIAVNHDSEELHDFLVGPTLTIFSFKDPVAGVKKVFEFSKENELPKIKAGIIDGQFMSVSKLEILSTLPSREELIAKAVGGMKSPINGFVNTLGGIQRKFVYAIHAISEQKKN